MFFGKKSLFCKFLILLLVIRPRKKKKKIRHTRRHKLQLNTFENEIVDSISYTFYI